ncbi:hypothetical protein AMAG_18551 [Allomyces macrogynus ATCC 38327]|uniref:tRNA (adenine(58)-N(1))-methyltransferase non-catalytic subunit TRM6 n=1 Tax=Allomyces macrogynus (strain ATCC 38327) TaxID=578462 RepID=A0A0L0SDA8_ALLM3|nr:hypothetical protein AMAG_18551 [Allomyces macrogynus ATCC 38327]|eukprot:KNE60518.1 hypothetical protein AMAG_18551 [Allomyces macrogynus ATCC 38327]
MSSEPQPTPAPAVPAGTPAATDSPATHVEAPTIASKPGIIRAGDHVLLVLPSENKRMLQIKPDATVELGKFGKFQTNALIGKPYGVPYEIIKGGELARAEVTPEDALGEADSDVKDANNKNIFDDNANQTLTHEEIATLKAEQASGHEIIAKIISSHTDFDKKTEFSKAKYIKKKRQTFLRQFTPVQLDAATLCDFYFNKNPAKTKEMRIDVLSLLLTSANVRAHSRLLIYDDTQGMVTAAEEDPRLYWERHRLSVFMRLSAKQRALYLLPPAYESVRHAKEIVAEVPTPEGETVDALAERLFGVMSLTSSVLSANSSPAAGPATAPVALPATKQSNFEFALEEFVLVVIKLTKVDLLEYGSEVADFQRLVWTLNKDGSWRSAETVSP